MPGTMPGSTTLAHISDVHVTPLQGLAPRHLNLKRTLGLANWHRGRKHVHLPHVADRLVEDMLAAGADHIAVTGDLCNIGLPSEYAAARAWLEVLGAPDDVTVVPGNHDIYTRIGRHPGIELWRDYMKGDVFGGGLAGAGRAERGFPIVRRVGCIALVGVNSATETRPFVAAGRVGRTQLAALEEILGALAGAGLARIVLIHHPPLPGQAPRLRALSDAAGLRDVLQQAGAELVLHGHNHRDMLDWCEHAGGRIPVIGIASGSAGRRHRDEPLARYNLVKVRPLEEGFAIEVTGRGLVTPEGGVVEIDRYQLAQ